MKNDGISFPILMFVGVVIVGSLLGGFLTFERHKELVENGSDLFAQRDSVIRGLELRAPRSLNGQSRVDWAKDEFQKMYRWNITQPLYWVYCYWLLAFAFFALAVRMLFRKQKEKQHVKDFRKRPTTG